MAQVKIDGASRVFADGGYALIATRALHLPIPLGLTC